MVFDFLAVMLHEPCMEPWQRFCNFCFKRISNMSFFFQHLVELERAHTVHKAQSMPCGKDRSGSIFLLFRRV